MEESKIWSKRKAYILNLLNWKDFITFVAQSGREEFKNERFCCSLTSQARNATTAFGNLSPVAERSTCGNNRGPSAFFHFANLLSPCREIHFHFVFVLFFVGYHRYNFYVSSGLTTATIITTPPTCSPAQICALVLRL